MFTGYNGENDQHHAIEVGANDLLRKPLMPDVLLSHTGNMINGHR